MLEFYASTEGDAVLANISGTKAGAKGRPLPGGADIELAAYDPVTGRLINGSDGFTLHCNAGEVGLLLTSPHTGVDPAAPLLRGVFKAGDSWLATGDLFRKDVGGDYWLMDNRRNVVQSARGPMFTQPIRDALADLDQVDLTVAYAVRAGEHELALAAVTLRDVGEITPSDLSAALSVLPREQRPHIVHVVDEIPLSRWYRPDPAGLRDMGIPTATDQVWHYSWELDVYVPLTQSPGSC